MSEFLKLEKTNCKNCYKCIRNCPVKSIKFSANQAHIVDDECILCGRCFVVCPQDAKKIADQTEIVKVLLSDDAPVVACVAPSFVAYFDETGFPALKEALVKLGFASAEETAAGATMVKREYDKLLESGKMDIIITSCCHTVNILIEKYYPLLARYLAPVITPMQAVSDDIKRRMPGAKTVFIGPCLSKKDEAKLVGVDACITFDELAAMFERAGVFPEKVMEKDDEGLARLFPTCGGILETMEKKNSDYTYMAVDGIENCIGVLDDISSSEIHNCFIEMSSCSGSCIGGPIMEKHHKAPVKNFRAVKKYAGKEELSVTQPDSVMLVHSYDAKGLDKKIPGEDDIRNILRQMDKFKPEDELNCGTCGYNTCREKAIAVYQGKAEIDMCLPFLMEKSERFSNNLFNNTLNGIVVLNDDLEVQQVNPAAMKMLRIRNQSDVLGEQVVRIMDPGPFLDVLNGAKIENSRAYFAEYDKYLEQTILHDKTSRQFIEILRDVTDEETERRNKEELSRQTAETADRVVEKQMRIVQEIASLLGETAAETKIALTKLKESIPHEDDE